MTELMAFIKGNLADHFLFYFVPLYILGGRPAAVLSAQLLGAEMFFVLPFIILMDTLQIPFFYHLYGAISSRPFMRRLYARTSRREERFRGSKLFSWVQMIGVPGIVVITMTPMKGCGMWSGVLLSRLLRLPKPFSYPLLVLGSVLGCMVLIGFGEVILTLKEIVG
jgi:uncharacterized membrane protein